MKIEREWSFQQNFSKAYNSTLENFSNLRRFNGSNGLRIQWPDWQNFNILNINIAIRKQYGAINIELAFVSILFGVAVYTVYSSNPIIVSLSLIPSICVSFHLLSLICVLWVQRKRIWISLIQVRKKNRGNIWIWTLEWTVTPLDVDIKNSNANKLSQCIVTAEQQGLANFSGDLKWSREIFHFQQCTLYQLRSYERSHKPWLDPDRMWIEKLGSICTKNRIEYAIDRKAVYLLKNISILFSWHLHCKSITPNRSNLRGVGLCLSGLILLLCALFIVGRKMWIFDEIRNIPKDVQFEWGILYRRFVR